MLAKLKSVASGIVESVLGLVGIRTGTEEPPHTARALAGGVEIRRYEPRIAAETVVEGDEDAARSEGFRRLAGYIFGGNRSKDSIAMTAPVAQARSSGQKIAMTAPVARTSSEDGWVIRFFMPSRWTMDTLPEPVDGRVRLVEVPAETVAALRFSGDRGPKAVEAKVAELLNVLSGHGIEVSGEPSSWFYDPPWTVPSRRRNEVVVRVLG